MAGSLRFILGLPRLFLVMNRELIEWINRGLQVTVRKMQIDGRMFQVCVSKEQLDGS